MPRVGGGNLLAQIRSIYVTIDAADASIREILESIEAQSDLRFIYADEVKPILTKVVTVREKNVSANRILDQILPDVGLQYSVGGTQVRIYQGRQRFARRRPNGQRHGDLRHRQLPAPA